MMNNISSLTRHLSKLNVGVSQINRLINTSATLRLKECKFYHPLVKQHYLSDSQFLDVVTQEKDSLVISGNYIPSPRNDTLLKAANNCSEKRFCPSCTIGLDIKHTDVLILSQYVRSDGCMLPRRITGLCRKQQKRIGTLVTMAQKAGT